MLVGILLQLYVLVPAISFLSSVSISNLVCISKLLAELHSNEKRMEELVLPGCQLAASNINIKNPYWVSLYLLFSGNNKEPSLLLLLFFVPAIKDCF